MTKTGTQVEFPLSKAKADWIKGKIRDIPDFPKAGIIFKDLTTLLKDAEAFAYVIDVLTEQTGLLKPDVIAGIEARGFIIAPAIAKALGVGFVPLRKPNKLPYKVERVTYDLEYGSDSIECHIDAVEKGQRVVLIDDLLATGGTANAATQLLEKVGGKVVGTGFIVELSFLNGREKLPKDQTIFSVVDYA